MIATKNLYLSYTKEYYTLNNINIDIEKGEKVVLYGEKESGKSSLIRILAGIEKATKGNVYLNNTDIEKVDFKDDISLGYVGTTGVFFNNKTVRNNLEYVLKIRHELKEVITSKVANALIRFNLEGIADKKIKELSNYEKIKVSLARLGLRKLDILLIDDIFNDLDKKESVEIKEYVKQIISSSDLTSLIATSNKKLVEYFGGRTITITFGSIE